MFSSLTSRDTVPAPYVVPPSQEFDGNDGAWSTFFISIGTPAQDFRVQVSTQSGETWVVVPEGCYPSDGADCPNLRGAQPFQSAESMGFQSNASTTWETNGIFSLAIEEYLNYTGNGIYGYDKVALGPASDSSAISLDHQVVAGVAELDFWMGHIGLGIQPSSFSTLSKPVDSFLVQLWNQTKIPSLSYAYTAGAKYRLKSVFGSLILGGYDDTRFTPSNFSLSFSSDATRLLTVGVQSIIGLNTLEGTKSFTASGHLSLIDSTVPHLWLPRTVCDSIQEAYGLIYDANTDLYLVNDTIHAALQSLKPTLTFKLGNTAYDTGANSTNIVLPYAALDLQASYPYYANATNYFPIRRAANDTQYVLGRTLLQETYLIVDHERSNFTLAPARWPDPLPNAHIVAIESPSNSTSSANPSAASKSKLGTGAIAGIAAGSAILLILAALATFLLLRRRKRNYRAAELANTQISHAGKPTGGLYDDPAGATELSGVQVVELGTPANEAELGMGGAVRGRKYAGAAGYWDSEGRLRSPGSPGAADRLLVEMDTPVMSPYRQEGVVHEMEGDNYVPSRTATPEEGYERRREK